MTRTALLLTLLLTTITHATEAHMNLSDQAAIKTAVEAVAVLADRGEFDALARLFGDELKVDYSSLNNHPASTKDALVLMSEWAAVLPGFDRTRHDLTDIQVRLTDTTATASAKVKAYHWVGDQLWQVNGHYDYQLEKTGNEWLITSMTFTLESESGSRDVFGPALAAAASKTLAGFKSATAQRNKQTVINFFKTLEDKDIPALIDLFAEDGVQINPYNGGVFPAGATGKKALLEYWTPVPDNFGDWRFPIDELLATEDPNIVFVRYRGEIKLNNNAGLYKNKYYSTFRFNNAGKITEYVEIFDPIIAARGFGLLDQLK